MKKKEILLKYLKKNKNQNFISSTELSKMLDVTDRSIRYYVKQLNEETPKIIETSREGYKYNAQQDLDETGDGSINSRRFSILQTLLKNGEAGVNLFDLAEKLWVSEATIRQDIAILQKMIQNEGLHIRQHDFSYYLKGNYDEKRQLIMRLIRQQGANTHSLEEEMQKFLGEIPLSEVAEACASIFKRYRFYTNNYFFQNFILHLIIALHQQRTTQIQKFSSPSLEMIEEISHWLYENYRVSLGGEDKLELALLCDGEKGHHNPQVESYVANEIAESLHRALQEISDVFLIDFTDEKFLTRLLLHTQNLYTRVKDKKIKRNLSAIEIKVRYPILFDIAVYLSSLIATDLDIEIAEDEIAFLALHLGSFLDEQKQNSHKIRTQLKMSGYLNREEIVLEGLQKRFDDELLFLKNSTENEEQLELVLSTEKITESAYYESVLIHEFLTEKDFTHIREAIERVKNKKYRHFLGTFLPQLIPKNAFLTLKGKPTKVEVFEKIGTWFLENKFADQGFSKKLFERESLSPTSFNSGIAVPHSIRYEGNKTGMLVLKPEEPLTWDGQDIYLILSFTINPDDSTYFNQLFPHLIEILTEGYHVDYLRRSENREEILERMIELLSR
ncbi:BglG family transcription antiterminator [Lactococcus garvieae]|uniref:BglG family transcription antiterminator n=1 Tax=Lactococcus garvieae TaxID=1363 RepID=UPI0009BDB2E0|nr:PTS sugar transporter subunit IIA [Lactococcus garvieae]